jgi:hypothetical protein
MALLLRSAVAYEADPHFWVTEIARDAPTQDALAKLERGQTGDPAVGEVAQVLFDVREQETIPSFGAAATQSPVENACIASALALSTLGGDKVLAALKSRLSARAFRQRWAAIRALAWMRFSGAAIALPPLAVEPFIQLTLVGLRLRAQRVKIASVAASALVGTVLVGIVVALTHVATALIVRYPNPAVQFILSLAIGATIGGVVGSAYGAADVIAPPSRPRVTMLLRLLAIIVGFAFANAFVIGASLGTFAFLQPLLIGALVGSGFAIANEWGLATSAKGGLKHILLSMAGLALTTGLATIVTIGAIVLLQPRDHTAWQFAGGVNPEIFLFSLAAPFSWIAYLVTNIVSGGIIGLGLVGGLITGDRLAEQLERARYV